MAKARPAEGALGSMTRTVAERVIYEANLGAEGRGDRAGHGESELYAADDQHAGRADEDGHPHRQHLPGGHAALQ